MPLTDSKIRSTKAGDRPIKLTDGGGLYLEVRPKGSKRWRYRYRIGGKENLFALGEYCQPPPGEAEPVAELRRTSGRLTLAEARAERERCRALVKQGVHPAHERKQRQAEQAAENANTFEAIAKEWIDKRKAGWSPYYLNQVQNVLEADVYPEIGEKPIRSVTSADLLGILRRVEGREATSIAILIRQWSSAIFRYATSTLRADSDPAMALKGAIHRPRVKHHKPLTHEQIVQFRAKLEKYGGYRTTVIALRLALLLFVRPVELRAAEWVEFDLDGAEWRIPGERMKMGDPHIVPLSKQAVTLLQELHTLSGNQRWLFPNHRRPRECMTATTLNRALERMGFNGKDGVGFSAHGFRATASTILNELGYRPDVIERQLAHKERNRVRASYNQAEYLAERRTMMQNWSDFIDGLDQLTCGQEENQALHTSLQS